MEEGVVSELLHSSLGEIFDHRQLITDVSGSGNNWYNVNIDDTLYIYCALGLLVICIMVVSIKKSWLM